MRRLLLAAALLAVASAAHAVPVCNLTPCQIVTPDPGGNIAAYSQLAMRLVRTKEPLEIEADCFSSCTILADRARPFVCIRPGAAFHIHQGSVSQGEFTGLRAPIDYQLDIEAWIEERGGQPTVGWLTMDFKAALAFWPECPKPSSFDK